MSDRKFVKLRSWHVVRTAHGSFYRTLCGRFVEGPTVEELPGGKSCEVCLRSLARQDERPADL